MRIIIDKDRDAEYNMAADRQLLEECAKSGEVFLRLYSWSPPAITLGCMQNAQTELNADAMRAAGVSHIARPTGGRAVLHDCDITYSFVFPKSARELGTTISQTYHLLSKCLLAGLARAGINCDTHDSDLDVRGTRGVKLPCFLAPNRSEIMVDGRKLVGSAQKRTADAVLQHGSIPINGNFRNLPNFLNIDKDERDAQILLLHKKCVCINELIKGATFDFLARCLIEGFNVVLAMQKQ